MAAACWQHGEKRRRSISEKQIQRQQAAAKSNGVMAAAASYGGA